MKVDERKSKGKLFNFRGDEKLEAKITKTMEDEELNQSAAIRYMLTYYGEEKHVASMKEKLANALFFNDLYNAINNIPEEYRKELLNVMEERKCQILY